jgi:7,8-dihydropterin-6-yl-methyl-4-(beta-D-ribofuranosyl)aminobenzene 5'-phosphate synthase
MKLTCVIENTATFASDFYAEHGLSILIEYEQSKILFDTGHSPHVLENNIALINGLDGLEYIVLSHGHNDHTGGLSSIIKNSSATILIHEKALLPKYVKRNNNMKFIGTDEIETKNSQINNNDNTNNTVNNIDFISETTKIATDIYLFADIPLNNDFERIDRSFYIKENGTFVRDNFEDELVMVIKTEQGLVIISGCAHRGIVNTISSIVEYFNDDVYAVIGGTHLISTNRKRINETIRALQKFDPKYLIFGHCNGFEAMCMFKGEFMQKFSTLEAGREIII